MKQLHKKVSENSVKETVDTLTELLHSVTEQVPIGYFIAKMQKKYNIDYGLTILSDSDEDLPYKTPGLARGVWTTNKCPLNGCRGRNVFKVSTIKHTFMCSKCGIHGDTLAFIMDKKQCSPVDAIMFIKQELGIKLDKKFNSLLTQPEILDKVLQELKHRTKPKQDHRDKL